MLTRRAQKNLVWIDLFAPTQEEIRAIMKEYDVHPLVADELVVPSMRQKTERYGDALYLVLHFPSFTKKHEHIEQEIDFVVGKKVLITATYEEIRVLHSFARTFETAAMLEHDPAATHGGHMLYLLVRRFYHALTEEIEYVRDEMRNIEERIFAGDEKQMVSEISRISRIILDFRRTLAPHQEILSSLEAAGGRLFGQEFSFYARLLQSELLKVQSGLDELRDSLQELRETNNSLLTTKQNEIMKTLTIMTFVMLPLNFITGIFGMNTVHDPIIGAPGDFWIILSSMLCFGGLLLFYFKHRKWL